MFDSTNCENQRHSKDTVSSNVSYSWLHFCAFMQKDKRFYIDKPHKFSAGFAIAVTRPTQVGEGWIARSGEDSLFHALQQIMPSVRPIRSDTILMQSYPIVNPLVRRHSIVLTRSGTVAGHPARVQGAALPLQGADLSHRVQQAPPDHLRLRLRQGAQEESRLVCPRPRAISRHDRLRKRSEISPERSLQRSLQRSFTDKFTQKCAAIKTRTLSRRPVCTRCECACGVGNRSHGQHTTVYVSMYQYYISVYEYLSVCMSIYQYI
jgi:hypothetical protein